MIFIVVGPDMAGKTTLCHSLTNKFYPVIEYRKFSHHRTQYESVGAAETITRALLKEPVNTDPGVVEKAYLFDRFHFPDDIVYGPATGRYEIDKTVMHRYTTRIVPELVRLQTAYIYCHASYEVLERRFQERGDDYIVPKHLPEILQRYEHWILGPQGEKTFPILSLDSGMMTEKQMIQSATDFIKTNVVRFRDARLNWR